MKKKLIILFLLVFSLSLFSQTANSIYENGFLKWKSNDGNFSTRFDIRAYLDGAVFFENKNKLSNGTHLRRARFAIKSKFYEKWNAEFDFDFADNSVEAKDMWLSYDLFNNCFVKAGHFKVPFSLNELTSSRLITFMERAYPTTFAPGRKMGLGFTKWTNKLFLSSAIYGQEIDGKKDKTTDEGYGFASRMAFAPIHNEDFVIHTGLGFVYQTPDDEGNTVEFKEEPETKIGDTEFCNTNDIPNVKSYDVKGVEGAFAYKNIHLQAEYMKTTVYRTDNLDNIKFDGGYAYLSWILTGEHQPYEMKEGEFGKIVPKNNYGAFEVAFRYSHLNLTDDDYKLPEGQTVDSDRIKGGKANNFTFALNWYANNKIRFMLNYAIVDNSIFADMKGKMIGDDDFSYLQMRILVLF
jgi:phosphate-selective porin OprO/OprP